jgi:DNA-binding CsgD family transcriptional regulator
MELSTPGLCPRCGLDLPRQKINMCAEVARTIRSRADLTYRQIAESFGLSARTVKRYARRAGLKRRKP